MPFAKIEKMYRPRINFPCRELVRWMKAEWEAAGIETVFPTSSSLPILIMTLDSQQLPISYFDHDLVMISNSVLVFRSFSKSHSQTILITSISKVNHDPVYPGHIGQLRHPSLLSQLVSTEQGGFFPVQ